MFEWELPILNPWIMVFTFGLILGFTIGFILACWLEKLDRDLLERLK